MGLFIIATLIVAFVMLCMLFAPFWLMGKFIHGENEYREDREDLRMLYHEEQEDWREEFLKQPPILHDARQLHLHEHKEKPKE